MMAVADGGGGVIEVAVAAVTSHCVAVAIWCGVAVAVA